MNRQFSKEEIQMASKYLKEMFNMNMLSCVTREMPIKTAFRVLTVRMAFTKKTRKKCSGECKGGAAGLSAVEVGMEDPHPGR